MLARDYFEYYLTDEEQDAFKSNLLKQMTEDYLWEYLDRDFDSFKDFLNQAFWFKETPEGNDYWVLLCSIRNDMHEKKIEIIKDFIRHYFSNEQERNRLFLLAKKHVDQVGVNEFINFIKDEE
jgi:hypothetical protein